MNDAEYPVLLSGISDPPSVIYFRGNIGVINERRNIAVVGSRHVSPYGIKLAYETGRKLAEKGINVVNGLASGCDTHALKGALSAGGKCIAVMPCGLGQIVPVSNTRLAEDVLRHGGCLISEYPAGTPVRKYQYVRRDRLQSGISDGVIVTEAEEMSGTMYTARFAMQQGRSLACIDGRLLKYASGNWWLSGQNGVKVIGCIEELDDFAVEICERKRGVFRQMAL